MQLIDLFQVFLNWIPVANPHSVGTVLGTLRSLIAIDSLLSSFCNSSTPSTSSDVLVDVMPLEVGTSTTRIGEVGLSVAITTPLPSGSAVYGTLRLVLSEAHPSCSRLALDSSCVDTSECGFEVLPSQLTTQSHTWCSGFVLSKHGRNPFPSIKAHL